MMQISIIKKQQLKQLCCSLQMVQNREEQHISLKSAFRGGGLGFSPKKRENQRNDIGACDMKDISKKNGKSGTN